MQIGNQSHSQGEKEGSMHGEVVRRKNNMRQGDKSGWAAGSRSCVVLAGGLDGCWWLQGLPERTDGKIRLKQGIHNAKILPLYRRIGLVNGQPHGKMACGVPDYSAFKRVLREMRKAGIGFLWWSDLLNEWMIDWMNEWMSECLTGWTSEWMHRWMDE